MVEPTKKDIHIEFRENFESREDLENYIREIKLISFEDETIQQAVKLIINSIYGAFANQYFHFYNIAIAEAVTLQGQDAIKYTEVKVEKYFREFWHKDKKLHEKMGIKGPVKPLTNPVWVYTDTDSIYRYTPIQMNEGNFQMESLYNQELEKNGPSDTTSIGHESTTTDLKILNYINGKIKYVPIKRLIRHKITKPRWKLKTKTGKEIYVTGDHSCIVFREGKQYSIKTCEIKQGDKVLIIKK